MGNSFLAISFNLSSVTVCLCSEKMAAWSVLNTDGHVNLKCRETDKR
jgi:hypothetical protein